MHWGVFLVFLGGGMFKSLIFYYKQIFHLKKWCFASAPDIKSDKTVVAELCHHVRRDLRPCSCQSLNDLYSHKTRRLQIRFMYPGATTFYHVVQVILEDNQETVFTTDAPSFLHTDDFIDSFDEWRTADSDWRSNRRLGVWSGKVKQTFTVLQPSFTKRKTKCSSSVLASRERDQEGRKSRYM